MALADLLRAIETEADEEAEAIVRAAEGTAQALLDEGRAAAIAAARAPVRDRESGLQAERARRLGAAGADAAQRCATAREDEFARALGRLSARLAAVRHAAEWPRILGVLVDEALSALPAGTVVAVHADPRDREPVTSHLALRDAQIPVVADLTSLGGVIAATADGRRADNTLEARVTTTQTQMRQRFAAYTVADTGAA